MDKRYSVAIRPTPEEIKRHNLNYDKAYYEDRAELIIAANPIIAVQKYIFMNIAQTAIPDVGIKKGGRLWMTEFEEKFVRAKEV